MTPKEKARQLYDKMFYEIEESVAGLFEEDVDYITAREEAAKQCALICVEEMLNNSEEFSDSVAKIEQEEYWQQIKTEIKNL